MKKAASNNNMWILVIIVAGLLFLTPQGREFIGSIGGTSDTGPSTSDLEVEELEQEVLSCDGVQSVNLLFDDKNAYKIGTDPDNNLTIYSPIYKQVTDDATSTTGPVLTTFHALAGQNDMGEPASKYFGKPITFETVCSDLNIQTPLYYVGNLTTTVMCDDGVTINTDSAHETVGASSTYVPCLTIKAPAERCAMVYGAYLVAEYDATYVSKVSAVSGLHDANTAIYKAHDTNHSGVEIDMDQYKIFEMDETMLCDGKKLEDICVQVETTASNPGEDQGNVQFHWFAKNYDVDADEFTLIGPAIYDEDNNNIYIGYVNDTWHVA